MDAEPIVYLVPTPVGNLGDITLRSLEVLRAVDAIAAEDTRRSRQLLTHFAIHKPLERLDAHTMRRAPQLLEKYARLAFVTDAGTPGLSDPGSELVAAALAAGVRVEVLPGATALVPALVLSGLPVGRFAFHGFLPRSGRERRERLAELVASPITTAIYESPYRLRDTLEDLARLAGPDRACAVVRELSKLHEECFRGSLGAALERFSGEVKGEIVVVLGPQLEPDPTGALPHGRGSQVDFDRLAHDLAGQGLSTRDIRDRLAQAGMDRKGAYALALTVARDERDTSGG